MRSIILMIFIFFSISSFSQRIVTDSLSYPIVTTDSIGNKIVILTIEQAKKIDNKLDLLELIKISNNMSLSIDSVCVIVIDEKNQVIANQDMQISKLDSLVFNKDEQIENLKMQIANQSSINQTFKMEIENKDTEIKLYIDRISNLEKRTFWSGIGSGVILVVLTTLILVK
jgi:hypothetical protein